MKILFRTSGGSNPKNELGMGHIYRCINLSTQLKPHKIIFLIEDFGSVTKVLRKNNLRTIKLIPGINDKEDVRKTIECIDKNQIDVLIIDKYGLTNNYVNAFPWVENSYPVLTDPVELLLNNTWKPMLSITGADGLPALKDSGNVLRPYTALKLSLRLPPTLDAKNAQSILQNLLLSKPPYGAEVSLKFDEPASGWSAPPLQPWLDNAVQEASKNVYGKNALYMGEGGTIPFMAMLGEAFPEAQFVITGVLGPQSNAHGPNEFIHIPYAEKLTASVTSIISEFPK